MYTILFYEVVDDYVNKRAAFRQEHLDFAREFEEKGQLILAGAFTNPVDGAALVFKSEDSRVAENFAQNDPYVKNGLITKWKVREWAVVIGEES
ncbi:MAG: hypothetical protein JXB23_12015 [Candidatus Aminicenantes bacterium]|nr:hypothetical protein [Candidatus Aminicenantes bacterium]